MATTIQLHINTLVIILLSIPHYSSQQCIPSSQSRRKNPILNSTYCDQVTNTTPVVYSYPRTSGAIRVTVRSQDASEESPILIIIKRQHTVLSWQLPLILKGNFSYSFVSRTLFENLFTFPKARPDVTGEKFSIEILTLSNTTLHYSVQAEVDPMFQQRGTESFSMQASPSAPQYVQYTMADGVDRVVVKLSSDTKKDGKLCSFFSVQPVKYPVSDFDTDRRPNGRYQTVTMKGTIEVTRDNESNGTFYIVVLVKPNDTDCEDTKGWFWGWLSQLRGKSDVKINNTNRVKTVNITIQESVFEQKYILPIVVPLSIFVVFFSAVSMVMLQTWCRGWRNMLGKDLVKVNLSTRKGTWGVFLLFERSIGGKVIFSVWDPTNYKKPTIFDTNPENNQILTFTSSSGTQNIGTPQPTKLEPDQETSFNIINHDENHITTTYQGVRPCDTTLHCITNINNIFTKTLTETAKEYSCTLIIVFLFYALPVLQLVMTHQKRFLAGGNQDICYYNFACANRVGAVSDFNHIISNSGYVILGLLFLLLVRRRAVFTAKLRQSVPELDNFGLPSQFGLFYGMGLALVMEGFMSAVYHVCPSYDNFQFDTSFMYLITGLLILKLYHSRHPGCLPQAHAAFIIFAVIVYIALIGIVVRDDIFWIVFSAIHGLVTVCVGIQIVVFGYLTISIKTFWAKAKLLRCGCCKEIPRHRIVLAISVTLVNFVLMIIGILMNIDLFMRPYDFASHLLFILQGNLGVYTFYYVVMKFMEPSEKVSIATCLYFLLAIAAWAPGVYYFTRGLSNWKVTPATSREGNQECFLFNFYDAHDVWHMLSAFGLFFTFMLLFTLDDDLATVEWEKITKF